MTTEKKLSNILDFYYETATLKEIERTGWKYWNISRNKRIESIPEHIYGTQQLAIAIYSEFELDIDIFKVLSMLSLHETEEIRIGDITPFDNISEQEKLDMGRTAVAETFSSLSNNKMFVDLINEFNMRETVEAKFAYLCDKIECDLQAKKYSDTGRCSFTGISLFILENEEIQNLLSYDNATLTDAFLYHDKPKFSECSIFLELACFLRKYSIKNQIVPL